MYYLHSEGKKNTAEVLKYDAKFVKNSYIKNIELSAIQVYFIAYLQ